MFIIAVATLQAAPRRNDSWEKCFFQGAAFFNARRGAAFGGAAPRIGEHEFNQDLKYRP